MSQATNVGDDDEKRCGRTGLLVLIALLIALGSLAALVHSWLYAISGFVGAGLVFAGITDWCGLGLLLARMPWNRVGGAASSEACCGS